MAGNKLAARKNRIGPPSQCRKEKKRKWWPHAALSRKWLRCYASYKDLDPLAPGAQSAKWELRKSVGERHYFGRSNLSDERMELEAKWSGVEEWWTITLWIWDEFRKPEIFIYEKIFIRFVLPFTTGVIGDVHIPLRDYRIIWIAE